VVGERRRRRNRESAVEERRGLRKVVGRKSQKNIDALLAFLLAWLVGNLEIGGWGLLSVSSTENTYRNSSI
jgi:hypothetical protein